LICTLSTWQGLFALVLQCSSLPRRNGSLEHVPHIYAASTPPLSPKSYRQFSPILLSHIILFGWTSCLQGRKASQKEWERTREGTCHLLGIEAKNKKNYSYENPNCPRSIY
jgi:hypothetical protein